MSDSETLIAHFEKALTNHYGKKVKCKSYRFATGGCINRALQIQTNEGDFFVKQNDAARYPGMFAAEAKGLNLLQSAGAMRVPEVIYVDGAGDFIILEFIRSSGRSKLFWENFGRALAGLHRCASSRFGLEHDNYIGSLRQSNRQHDTWNAFFIRERLEPQVKLALNEGKLSKKHAAQFENLYKRISDIFPHEPPALLHGDLWNGNFMTGDDGEAWLIDPAVYYGNREMEIAFTRLFGGFDVRFYNTYQEVFPLQPGFHEREALCNLYPLLAHVNLFGGGYLTSVESILKSYS